MLSAQDAIYVQVNRFAESPARPYADFVAETLARARASGARRYVIDLRHNSGGIGAWTTPFLNTLAGLGRAHELMESPEAAAKHYREALIIEPDNALARQGLKRLGAPN